MNLETAKRDTDYEDATVQKCVREEDGWNVTWLDGWSLFVADESGTMAGPEPGTVLRMFGRGVGWPVRGIGLVAGPRHGGELVGLYRYQTKEEYEADMEQRLREEKERRRKAWEDGKEAFAARVKALPEAFRERIEFFMRRQDWGPEFGGYELFSCEEAVKITKYVGHAGQIRAFYDDREAQKQAGMSSDHSGNTFGTACLLATAFLRDPHLVPKMHGALCPLVGCHDYGCYSTVPSALQERDEVLREPGEQR